MSNCNNCLPTSITWSPANDGTLNCTGTSASTVYTCYSNETIFFTDYDVISPDFIFQYNPSIGSIYTVTGASTSYQNGIANTNSKFWVQGADNASIDEYTISFSPIISGSPITVSGPINKTITGNLQLNSLVAISEDVLICGGQSDFSGNKINILPVSGSSNLSLSLFSLPYSDGLINDIKYDAKKQTLVITYYDNDLFKYFISEYTTGGTMVNQVEIPLDNIDQIVSLALISK